MTCSWPRPCVSFRDQGWQLEPSFQFSSHPHPDYPILQWSQYSLGPSAGRPRSQTGHKGEGTFVSRGCPQIPWGQLCGQHLHTQSEQKPCTRPLAASHRPLGETLPQFLGLTVTEGPQLGKQWEEIAFQALLPSGKTFWYACHVHSWFVLLVYPISSLLIFWHAFKLWSPYYWWSSNHHLPHEVRINQQIKHNNVV